MSKKIILTIGITVLIILGISIYFWRINKVNPNPSSSSTVAETSKPPITQTLDDASGFRVYKNETIGIEFKYPNNWPILESNNIGDEMRDGKIYTSFSLNLVDLSHLGHTILNMDNMPIDKQYEKIKCPQDSSYIECEEKISDNGVKYVWIIEETKGGAYYEALVATGKYILIFNFQEKDNYEKRASEYQELLSTLKIAPTPTFNSDISDWKTYRNEKYGFELAFPSSWNEHIAETNKLEMNTIGEYDSIYFGFYAQNPLFNINVFTIDQWKKFVSLEINNGRPEPNYISKNEKYIFNVGGAQYTENQEMSDRMSEIENILSTFKFIK